MNDTSLDQLSPLRQALVALEKMQAKLEAVERARTEPIAIIGMACRFPGGADDPEALWQLVASGKDAISEVPPDRWDRDAYYDPDPDAPCRMNTRWGGFLDRVDQFDREFFAISPLRAAAMDPQQRLLLEVVWEALEDAGQTLEGLAASHTGAFVGASSSDYAWQTGADGSGVNALTSEGTAHSILANRLSYQFDLRGPSVTVDTACSSSLVAVHMACQSLRSGESGLAIAAGVNVILAPGGIITFSRARMTSPDGRCKTFDADANGFVLGEGCGALILKRLSAARADGDRILALIRGSAVNQDGRATAFQAPNGPSQQALLRQALASGGVDASRISYVEVHGTGTAIGDAVEVEALAHALGQPGEVDTRGCALGTVKTNIGHLSSASGVAGLIKVVQSMRHEAIPPVVHMKQLNPRISLEGTRLVIPTTMLPWESKGDPDPRLAGVSAFGFGGTNAHVVLEEAPAVPPAATIASKEDGTDTVVLPVSARSHEALKELAQRYRALLLQGEASPRDIAFTAGVRRSHHQHRLALTGRTRSQLVNRLSEFLTSERPLARRGLASGTRPPNAAAPALAWVFPHQCADAAVLQLAREWRVEQRVFREAFDLCSRVAGGGSDRSAEEWLNAEEFALNGADGRLLVVSMHVGLAAQWRAWGLTPDAMAGWGIGEVAAAHLTGVLSLEEAARLAERWPEAAGALTETMHSRKANVRLFIGWAEPTVGVNGYSNQFGANGASEQVNLGVLAGLLRDEGIESLLEIGTTPRFHSLTDGTEEDATRSLDTQLAPDSEGQPAGNMMLETLAVLYSRGFRVAWDQLYPEGGRVVSLPRYPWQRKRYWLEPGGAKDRDGVRAGEFAREAPVPPDGLQSSNRRASRVP